MNADDNPQGPRGNLGNGTPGSRLRARRLPGMSMRAFALTHAASSARSPFHADAVAWFANKSAGYKRAA